MQIDSQQKRCKLYEQSFGNRLATESKANHLLALFSSVGLILKATVRLLSCTKSPVAYLKRLRHSYLFQHIYIDLSNRL